MTLEPNRTYRAVCYNAEDGEAVGDPVEVEPFDKWADAHYCTLEWDSLYFPTHTYWVERSLDGGATWHPYDAMESIAGRPAWTYDDL